MSYTITLTPDGIIEIAPYPESDVLPYLQQQVGGYIEHLDISCKSRPLDMYLNEEGLLIGLEHNRVASYIVNRTWIEYYEASDDAFIVGNVVITGGTPDGDARGLTLDEVKAVSDMVHDFATANSIDITVE